MADLTDSVTWTSDDVNVIGINEDRRGEVSIEGTGKATITATIEGQSGELEVRVTDD